MGLNPWRTIGLAEVSDYPPTTKETGFLRFFRTVTNELKKPRFLTTRAQPIVIN
jgi:hypothetical protein